MIPRLSYFICNNARSGSWLLAAGLEDTRLAGHPSEWFNEPEVKLRCEQWGLPYPIVNYEHYLTKVIEAGSAGTGVFGVKCLQENFRDLTRHFATVPKFRGLPMAVVLSMVFPNTHYIRLIRHDLNRQAVSYYRASQTQVWFSIEDEPDAPGNPAVYDPTEILRHERMLAELEASWDDYFQESGIQPLIVYYEDLAENYPQTIRSVLGYLGIEGAEKIKIAPPRFKKQADEITEEWVRRYKEYKANKGLP